MRKKSKIHRKYVFINILKYLFFLICFFILIFLTFVTYRKQNIKSMKRVFSFVVSLVLLFSFTKTFAQDKQQPLKPIVQKAVWFRVSPPLTEMIKNANHQKTEGYREIENELEHDIIVTKLNVPDALSPKQRAYGVKGETLNKITDFDGVNNIDGVAPPDTQGDVSPDYYMQCVNNHTEIWDKNGNVVQSAFPTSDFWQGSGYDDRNDGDAVILWDEDAQRWVVTQFYLPSSGSQYLLIAISQTSDPTGSYYQYAFPYTYMPDYPKWAVWPDGYYMGANAFDQNNGYSYEGVYVTAFERDKMLIGDANAQSVTFGPDASLWSIFPADADAFPASGTPCPFISDQVDNTSGNNQVYIYDFHVDWTNTSNSSFSSNTTLTVTDYGLFSSDEQVPQPGTSQKLDLLQSRIMYRPYFRHFSDHDAIVMARTVNDGGISAIRWYEFRNSGSGWSVYQQGTYNPGDGLWRWMPSIAMNANGDIAIGYSVSDGTSEYPSIRCVARYASDPLNVMTTNEAEFFTGTASQDASVSRWGDYSMMSIDPSDNTSFWFTTEYSNGGWNWRTRIIHFELPTPCTGPSTQASNFSASNIGDNQMDVSWTRGNGDRVLVVAHQGAPVDADPSNGTSYTANSTFGNGSEIGSGNYVVYDGTGGSVTVTGLTPGTTYYFAIYEYFTADNCYNSDELTGNATTTGTAPCSYCYSWGHTTYNTSTTRVIFNTIDNASAKPTDGNGNAYSDYTNISTDVYRGSSYDLTVQVNTDGDYTVATKVWIDWNHDCDFDDAGEEYDLGTAQNVTDGATSNSPLSITIPTSATLGQTTMRVSSKYNAYATSCETDFDGEVEDYTVNVLDPNSPTITVSETALDFGEVGLGYYSTKTYDVSGTNLTDDITVTGTSDFLVSTDGTNFSTSVTVPQSGGNASATITVKFEPTAVQTYSGTITNTSTGATQKDVACTGEGIQWFPAPQNLTASTSGSSVTLNWDEPANGGSSTNWYYYIDINSASSYVGSGYPIQMSKFDDDDLGYTYPIKITQLRAGFYEASGDTWTSDQFKFIIYGENMDTIFISPNQTAQSNQEITYTLPNPIFITGDFYMGIVTVASDGTPYLLAGSSTTNHSYANDGTNWYVLNGADWDLGVYIDNAAKGQYIAASGVSNDFILNAEPMKDKIKIIETPKSALNGYYIYKDGSLLTSVNGQTTTYTDNDGCGDHSYYVTAVYQDYDGESDASNTVNTSIPNTAITQQPSDQNVCAGDNASFSVTATGSNLTYQWQKDGSNISGATSNTLTLTNVSSSDAGSYTCVVSGDCGTVTSNAATLTLKTATAITSQPSSQTVCEGDNASFSVSATGENLTYQWQKNGSNISGATSSTLTLNNVTSADAGNYTCVVTGDCGSVTSNAASLTVNPATAITQQPTDATACAGDDVTFSVTATGSNLTYQWQKDGSNISGATSSTLTLSNVSSSDAGSYTCVVSGDCGTATSNAATLTINPATAITQQPSDATACEGDNVTFSVTATGSNLTYQWNKDGVAISGATSSTLTLSNVTSTDAASYTCEVSGDCGNVTSNAATLTVNPATAITSQSGDQSACAGSDVTFSVTATGSNLTYQWQKDGSNISGATSSSLTLTNVSTSDEGTYTCVVSGDCGNVTSNGMTLTITSSLTLGTVDDQQVCPGGTATFTVTANGTNPTYQWRKNGTNLTDGGNISGANTATLTISNVSSSDVATYSCYVTSDCGDATSNDANLTLNDATVITSQPQDATVCEGDNVTFSVTATGSNLTYQWYKSGVAISGATSANYSLTNVTSADAAGYYCEVTGDCGTETSNTATLTVNENTAITTQPQSQDVCEGSDVTFTVVATGSNLTYQWQKDGSDISGATSDTYTITGVTANDAGSYTCVVSGDCGSVTSDAAILSIGAGVTITQQPQSQDACEGSDVTFSVVATGDNLTYQWQKDGSDISGATSSVLTLTNVTSSDEGSYTCVITSDCGSVTSDAATLTIGSGVTITQQPTDQSVCEGGDATFTVVATGDNLTYQWQKDGSDISGATSDTYTITGVTATDEGSYTCVITSDCGSATSDAATLSLLPATQITTQPMSVTDAHLGDTVVFTVVADGSNLTYQWQLNAANIDGATSDTYTINGVTDADTGIYTVVVNGDCGSVTSEGAVLAVVTTDLNTLNELGIKLYPNPTDGNFTIAFNKITDEYNVSIVDATGKVVYTNTLNDRDNRMSLNLPAGIYTVKVYNATSSHIIKMVVK